MGVYMTTLLATVPWYYPQNWPYIALAIFSLGLVTAVCRPGPRGAIGVSVMVQAAALLFIATANDLGHAEGQATGLVLLGLLPALYVAYLTRVPAPQQPSDGDEGGSP